MIVGAMIARIVVARITVKKSDLVFLLLFCLACLLVFIDNPICLKGESLCVTRTGFSLTNNIFKIGMLIQ